MKILYCVSLVCLLWLSACASESSPLFQTELEFDISNLGTIWSIDWDQSGELIAISSAETGSAYVFDLTTGTRNSIVDNMGHISQLSWCDEILAGSGKQAWVWYGNVGNTVIKNTVEWSDYYYYIPISWDHNCQNLVTVYRTLNPLTRPLHFWNTKTGETREVDLGGVSPSHLDWNPRTNLLAISFDNSSDITVFDTEQEKEVIRLGNHKTNIATLEWNSDGFQLASGDEEEIIIWDASTWQSIIKLNSYEAPLYQIRWHPQGDYIAGVSSDGVHIWNVQTGSEVIVQKQESHSISWNPNGNKLATTIDDRLVVWDIDLFPE